MNAQVSLHIPRETESMHGDGALHGPLVDSGLNHPTPQDSVLGVARLTDVTHGFASDTIDSKGTRASSWVTACR